MAGVPAALVGAGQRGHFVYGAYALQHPEELQFVAVADRDPSRLCRFAEAHGIPRRRRYSSTGELLASEPGVEAAVVATPDPAHAADAIPLLEAGWAVLLEKPIASTAADTVAVARAGEGRLLQVALVLRFTPFFRTLHRVIVEGQIGEVITTTHRENVAAWHMAHSFVRGNWGRRTDGSPMIVQKCCHDLDVMAWNLSSPIVRISSFGSLRHFRPDRAPEEATARCTDPCPVVNCPYDARSIYLDQRRTGWPIHVISDDLSPAGRLEALRSGRFGRCVYTSGSDVVDNQIVAMELEDGTTAGLVMHGHSTEENRTMRYDGTLGTLRARFGPDPAIEVTEHGGAPRRIEHATAGGGHGGGDQGVIRSFLRAIEAGTGAEVGVTETVAGHMLAFAAEESRTQGRTVEMSRFVRAAAGTP